jgi:hypothetical protein
VESLVESTADGKDGTFAWVRGELVNDNDPEEADDATFLLREYKETFGEGARGGDGLEEEALARLEVSAKDAFAALECLGWAVYFSFLLPFPPNLFYEKRDGV